MITGLGVIMHGAVAPIVSMDIALSNSFAFGGLKVVVAMSRYDG